MNFTFFVDGRWTGQIGYDTYVITEIIAVGRKHLGIVFFAFSSVFYAMADHEEVVVPARVFSKICYDSIPVLFDASRCLF